LENLSVAHSRILNSWASLELELILLNQFGTTLDLSKTDPKF
jgi:hypothetical protein